MEYNKIVWWELRNTSKLIPLSDFFEKAKELGFEIKTRRTRTHSIITEVCKRLKLTKKTFVYGGRKYIGGFADKNIDDDSLYAKAVILLRLDDQSLICKSEEASELVENLKGKATVYKIMQYVVKWIEQAGGFNLRRSGALYFIPQEKSEIVAKISELLEHFDIGSIRSIDVYPSPESIKSLVTEFLADMKVRLDDLQRIADSKKSDRPSKVVKKVHQLREMLDNYQKKFSIDEHKLEEIRNRLKILERRFVKVVR